MNKATKKARQRAENSKKRERHREKVEDKKGKRFQKNKTFLKL